MDDQAFDRLARAVSRARDGATRRGVLRSLVGAALAVPALVDGDEAGARRHNPWWWGNSGGNNWGCRYNGTPCTSSRQCCNGSCRGNICGGNNYPGNNCGNTTCQAGWKCCKVNGGAHVCTPSGYGTCCGNSSFSDGYSCCGGGTACPSNMKCCGGGLCCPSGMKCCGSMCCPSGFGCRNGTCTLRNGATTRSGERPVPATSADPKDMITVAPGEGEA